MKYESTLLRQVAFDNDGVFLSNMLLESCDTSSVQISAARSSVLSF